MVSTTEQMESMLPSTDTDYYNTPEQNFTAAGFASDSFKEAKERFMDAGKIDVNPDDPAVFTAYKRAVDYLKDTGLAGLGLADTAFKYAVGSVAQAMPTEQLEKRLARDLYSMPEAFGGMVGGKNLTQLDDAADAFVAGSKKVVDDYLTPDPNTLFLFGGVGMKGAAKDKNLKKAIDLLKKEDSYKESGSIPYDANKKIWSETGWYVDPADGQWRYFIDDTKASLKDLDEISNINMSLDARNPTDWKNVKVSDIFDHPEFYEKYPELKNFEIAFYNAKPNRENIKLLGSYDELTNTLEINMGADAHRSMVNGKYVTNVDGLKKTVLHELQHVIQKKESFVRGTSSGDIPPDLVHNKDRELRGKKKPISKEFDKIKRELNYTDEALKINQAEIRDNPLPGLTIEQEIEIYNKHYSKPDERTDVTWASTAREYGVPVSRVQKAAGRTNLVARLNKERSKQSLIKEKLAGDVYGVDKERSKIETYFYEGAGGEIEARLTEEMLDPSMTIAQLESGATAKDIFPVDARAGMLEKEGNMYQYQGKYGVDPFNYEIKPRREPESTNLVDTVKKKLGLSDNVKPLTTAKKESLSADFQRIIDPSVNDNPDIFKSIFLDDEYAREILAEFRSPTRDITGDPAKLSEVQSLRNEIYGLTQEALKDLPEEVTVYRYGPLNKKDGVTSFTLDPLYGGSDPSLHLPWVSGKDYALESYTVKKSDILAAPDLVRDFGEAEVIIKNDAVKKEPKNFAKGGDTVRPEPIDGVDISPRAEAGDQFFVKQAERERAFETKPMPRPSMDKSFPNVKPEPRPEGRSEFITRGYEVDGREIQVGIIKFKGGEEIALDKVLQNIDTKGTANEPVVTKNTMLQVINFLKENNPTREEFETYWYNKRLNKGGAMMDKQMQMAFMDEGGLTDDGMDVDPVSGNDVPSGSMSEEVRDDIPAQLSEGEYVVPADVVRYYGVKFFEDLRERAKMGLQEMEMNGRIGGEPVPAGGPINNEELSPEEMQAIQEMMGMSEGGQVRGYQAAGSVTGNQVEQQMLSAGSAAQAENYVGSPLGFSIFGDSSTGVQNPNQQPETPTFTPITLYNTAGQTRTVNSEAEKTKAIADKYTMTLAEYNMYLSKRGGGGGTSITPPGQGEDQEVKPWGQDLKDWNDVDDIKQFVAQAERGNLSGSGSFLRGAGFAIAGLPGAMLAGAFQSFKGLNALYDIEAAQIIAEAKGKAGSKEHAALADKLKTDITTYLEKAGGLVNFAYQPRSKNVMNKVNGVFVGTGYEDVNSWAAGTSIKPKKPLQTKNVDALRTKMQKDKTSKINLAKAKVTGIKSEAKRTGKSIAEIGREKAPSSKAKSASQQAKDEGDPRAGLINKGGLMTKGKKKK